MATKKTKTVGDADRRKETKRKDELSPETAKLLEEEKNLIVKLKRLEASAKAGRRRYDWEWLVRNLYLRGYHFARYNRASSTFVLGTRTKVRIPINLMWAQARAIRNQVTSFRPKWEVLPQKPTEASFENAKYSGKLLDNLYIKLKLKRKLKESIYHGLYTSIGIWQFDWDKTADKGEGEVRISVVDPFDFFIDPSAENLDDAMYIIKAVRKPLSQVRTDPRYDGTEVLKSDPRLASSEYKEFLLQAIKTIGETRTAGMDDENEYTIIKEAQLKEYQPDGAAKIRIIAYTDDSEFPLRNELTEEDDFNYELFQADIQPQEIYGESWAKQVMPVNRVLDALESHVFEYNHFFAKGRFVIDKGSGVRAIINEHGHIIEKNPGYMVTSLPVAPLPMATFQQITNMRQYMEDIGGLHEVSLGRIPVGVKSGIGIAELRQADATSQDDLVDALEDFLVRASKKIFRIAAKHYTTAKLAQVAGTGGKPEYFYAVGESSPIAKDVLKDKERQFGEMGLPIAVIGSDNEVRVTVGSWLAYTKQARQEELKELFRLGAIDQKTLLEHLEFGDIDSIADRTRNERLIQLRQGMASQPGQKREISDEELALAENELMDEGTPQPVKLTDDHEIHLPIHKEGLSKSRRPEVYLDHMSEHINQMQTAPKTSQGLEALLSATGAPGLGGGVATPPEPVVAGPASGFAGGAIPTPPLTTGE